MEEEQQQVDPLRQELQIRQARGGCDPRVVQGEDSYGRFVPVYARWPSAKGNNPKTRFQISTTSGPEKVRVNQRRDGGVWMRLGASEMKAGNRYSVRVAGRSEAEGRVSPTP